MVDIDDICGHPEPAWRDQADSLVMYDLTDSGMPGKWEQLWAKRLDDDRYMLCCIPFFTSDIALGDIFTTTSSGGFELSVDTVAVRSGNVVIHALFREDATTEENEDRQGDLIEESVRLGVDREVFQLGYVALSCPIGSPEHVEIEKRLYAYHLLEWGDFETSKRSE
ncbi:DUF4265 domain-containing protein [Streptomyces nodosus]|uniref:DUF4265 domain-containing protein n=1 Tax=Streptomyces nodosus TaxID=40318 RepID=A0A5P2WEP0_9ACTN|nr:DUF4265 domain-containing protein [Streptomyces nodosus]MBB4795360.1 hypothetical protein [Streptomyces nodosus]QEV42323.1 DUF4265 domain-containing protein [Streptomyces nodosus]